ncbi:MAG TPA: hypothetical protein PL070_18110 [Flavobacteriales bacterium]|nr:hypothetical protein [Flavobacteriales bacterium]
MKARIYEIKSSAAANAEVLRDEENDSFCLSARFVGEHITVDIDAGRLCSLER